MKFLIITSSPKGVIITVSDEDRTWKMESSDPLPPDFVEYDGFQEIQYVLKEAKRTNAPVWVTEKLKKYQQTLR